MNILIIKLNATGDVVRTTTLLHHLKGNITWVTAANNTVLLDGVRSNFRCLTWTDREKALDSDYDLVISLEDEVETAKFLLGVRYKRVFGAYLSRGGKMTYSEDARQWFDLSLISVYGRQRADELKYLNRRTYQEMIFEGLGFKFSGESYVLPEVPQTDLVGDVAIAPVAGPVWAMKKWAHYDKLQTRLEAEGLKVNILPKRPSLLEHIGDVKQHRVLVGGDSLPMHLALGVGTPCVSIFNCTSPWEIHDYGIQTKLVSPLLGEFFYKRGFDLRATTAISMDEVFEATLNRLKYREA